MCKIDISYANFMLANERKNLSPESMRYYRENVSRFIRWLDTVGVYKAQKINAKLVDDYFAFLLRTVPNRTSVNTYMRAVRRYVNYLAEQKLIRPIKTEPLKDKYKIKSTFDMPEVERILKAVDPSDDTSVIILLLLACSIRSRSLRELCVNDIHIDDRYIEIRHTKNGEPLCLPISDDVAIVLRQYIAYHARHGLMFANKHGNMFNRRSLARRINTRLRKLGIPEHKSGVHIFRHTFGKIMSMNACPTTVLQRWFGHSDIRITQRYIDLYGNDLKNTMAMLPTSGFTFA